MKVFVSTCEIDRPQAVALIESLRAHGFSVTHTTGFDPHLWNGGRYSGECAPALAGVDVFIAVITECWKYSTLMKAEAIDAANCCDHGGIQRMCYFNPGGFDVTDTELLLAGREPIPLLRERLPDDLDNLIRALKEE